MQATKFRKLLASLEGKRCWAVVAGMGNGSMVAIDLGRKIKRPIAVSNPKISPDVQKYVGEYLIFVRGCAWRLECGNEIIGGWGDKESQIAIITQRLVGRRIRKVAVMSHAFDLQVSFEGKLRLTLFCDQTTPKAYDNYAIKFPIGWCTVAGKSELEFEPI